MAMNMLNMCFFFRLFVCGWASSKENLSQLNFHDPLCAMTTTLFDRWTDTEFCFGILLVNSTHNWSGIMNLMMIH